MQTDGVQMNTIIYTTMIKGYSKAHKLDQALELYEIMKKDQNVEPNNVTYNSLLDCCVRCDNMKQAQTLFNEMKQGFQVQNPDGTFTTKKLHIKPDLITFSTLIKGYCKERFNKSEQYDSYGESKYGSTSSLQKAFEMLKIMEKEKIKPDEVLFNSLLDGCCKSNEIDLALTVYKAMREQHIKPSNVTFSILVKIYGKSKQLTKALNVLKEMKELKIKPGIVVYTCIIQTCIKAKQINIAFEKFEEMNEYGIQGDSVTYQTLLKGCTQFKKYSEGVEILEDAVKNNIFIAKDVTEPLFSAVYDCKDTKLHQKVSTLKDKMKNIKPVKSSYKKNYENSNPNYKNSQNCKSKCFIIHYVQTIRTKVGEKRTTKTLKRKFDYVSYYLSLFLNHYPLTQISNFCLKAIRATHKLEQKQKVEH